MKQTSFLLFVFAFLFSSCTDDRERKAFESLSQAISSESQNKLKLIQLTKINGIEKELGAGTKAYLLQWTAEIEASNEFWKAGNNVEGYWQSFHVMSAPPKEGWDSYLAGSTKHFEEGAKITLTGESVFVKTDNGWLVQESNVQSSKESLEGRNNEHMNHTESETFSSINREADIADSIAAAQQASRAMEEQSRLQNSANEIADQNKKQMRLNQYMVEGIVIKIEPQGNQYLEVLIKSKSDKINRLWLVANQGDINWASIKLGKRIGANGKWIQGDDGKELEPTSIKFLD